MRSFSLASRFSRALEKSFGLGCKACTRKYNVRLLEIYKMTGGGQCERYVSSFTALHKKQEYMRSGGPNWAVKRFCQKVCVTDNLQEFEKAAFNVHFVAIPNKDQRMKLAGLYMQAVSGPPDKDSKPDVLREMEYWEAWNANRDLTQAEARALYIGEVRVLQANCKLFERKDEDFFSTNDILIK